MMYTEDSLVSQKQGCFLWEFNNVREKIHLFLWEWLKKR